MAAQLPPDRFWEITPRLTLAEIEAVGVRLDREADYRAWQAWHTAYLPRSEKPVPLSNLLSGGAKAESEDFLAMRLASAGKGLRGISMADHLKGLT